MTDYRQFAQNTHLTIGILYGGDMGSAMGRVLHKAGFRVLTTCQDRSSTTKEQAQSSGLEILPKLDDVFARSHIIFSILLQDAAADLARKYADFRRQYSNEGIFVEANSIGLDTLEQIRNMMTAHGIAFVDAAIHGTADRLEDIGVLYLSGPIAQYIEPLFRKSMQVEYLGEDIGSATRLKLILSGISKTFTATFLDLAILAERADIYEPFLKSCRHFYPGIITAIERMLPTYPRHAARRICEIKDIEQMARSYRLNMGLTHQAGELLKLVADIDWSHIDRESQKNIHKIIQIVGKIQPFDG